MMERCPIRGVESPIEGDPANPEILDSVREAAFRSCMPLNATIELTHSCNLRCRHCYNCDRSKPASPNGELSRDETIRVVSELREAGCLFLSFSGGEPLTHPHFFDFLDHASRLHMGVQLLTNGTLLSRETVKRLAGFQNLMGASISLYGATPGVHDTITGVEGSFDLAWSGAKRLREAGVRFTMKFLVMKSNLHEVADMLRKFQKEGVPFKVDTTVTGRHDGEKDPLRERITTSELERLYRGPLQDLLDTETPEPGEKGFACNCARGNCAISATGEMFPCIAVPLSAGNLRESTFSGIWHGSEVFRMIRGLRMADYRECAPCPLKASCTRDRGAGFLSSGTYTGIDPWICRQAEVVHRISGERNGAK